MPSLYRYTAFSSDPQGGNPAGIWIGDALPDAESMQSIAAEVGYSETAFVAPSTGAERLVRYFSPEAVVSFCGHATIATGVVLGELGGAGTYRFATAVGEVAVSVQSHGGQWEASLTSVEPRHDIANDELIDAALAALHWRRGDLDHTIPAARAYAGAWHLVLAVKKKSRLATIEYDFDALKSLMLRDVLTTMQLIWRPRAVLVHSLNPFPVGGVVEDPATGAAAAALGGYLRDAHLVSAPTRLLVRQGETMGRPSRLMVEIPASGGVIVRGTAVDLGRSD